MKPYANLILYSDIIPFEVIDHTAKTITVREMKATRSKDFVPDIIPGGFCGRCINQQDQKWDIVSDPAAREIRAYLHKDGLYWSKEGAHSLSDHPVKFYDYNF